MTCFNKGHMHLNWEGEVQYIYVILKSEADPHFAKSVKNNNAVPMCMYCPYCKISKGLPVPRKAVSYGVKVQ